MYTIVLLSNHYLPDQIGIWVKFYHFLPKNDDEKWSRKNIFEIPSCAHHVIFIIEFVLLTKAPPFYEVNMGIICKKVNCYPELLQLILSLSLVCIFLISVSIFNCDGRICMWASGPMLQSWLQFLETVKNHEKIEIFFLTCN